jgi:hypothetical protein
MMQVDKKSMNKSSLKRQATTAHVEVVDSIENATAPQMLWGRAKRPKKSNNKTAPISLPQYVYLFECSFDASIIIAGITYQLDERSHARGYGRILWTCRLPSRAACVKAESRFLQATRRYAVGPEYRGMTTWTEARRMSVDDAITAWIRAIGKKCQYTPTTYQ